VLALKHSTYGGRSTVKKKKKKKGGKKKKKKNREEKNKKQEKKKKKKQSFFTVSPSRIAWQCTLLPRPHFFRPYKAAPSLISAAASSRWPRESDPVHPQSRQAALR